MWALSCGKRRFVRTLGAPFSENPEKVHEQEKNESYAPVTVTWGKAKDEARGTTHCPDVGCWGEDEEKKKRDVKSDTCAEGASSKERSDHREFLQSVTGNTRLHA